MRCVLSITQYTSTLLSTVKALVFLSYLWLSMVTHLLRWQLRAPATVFAARTITWHVCVTQDLHCFLLSSKNNALWSCCGRHAIFNPPLHPTAPEVFGSKVTSQNTSSANHIQSICILGWKKCAKKTIFLFEIWHSCFHLYAINLTPKSQTHSKFVALKCSLKLCKLFWT